MHIGLRHHGSMWELSTPNLQGPPYFCFYNYAFIIKYVVMLKFLVMVPTKFVSFCWHCSSLSNMAYAFPYLNVTWYVLFYIEFFTIFKCPICSWKLFLLVRYMVLSCLMFCGPFRIDNVLSKSMPHFVQLGTITTKKSSWWTLGRWSPRLPSSCFKHYGISLELYICWKVMYPYDVLNWVALQKPFGPYLIIACSRPLFPS